MVSRNEPCPCGSGKKLKKCHPDDGRRVIAPTRFASGITVKTAEEIEGMRRAGRLAGRVLAEAVARVRPGITTNQINTWVHEMTLDAGAYPSPLNYPKPPTDPRAPVIAPRAFPKSVCTSLNDVVCHGIPDATELKEGDILNVDVTCTLDGYHGDTSRTVLVGEVSDEARRITRAASDAMDAGIATVRDGALFYAIGDAIETIADQRGFSVVRDFTGHGIGRRFHEPPPVLHYRDPDSRFPMLAGMIFTIEPMLNAGTWEARIDPRDHWTARTLDGRLSAQFEHTILVTATGPEILTAA